ncbi:leucyl aminopeptidase [Demequina zhanjiangensis]|uniref:Probable cytosol aminopeptidase n=1 Tax=Demequina zhanjiangensis TaxID=3051659 RepID=A0ABT8G0Q4_9MICO|nr:leucyl aminopeptidase [Demequina sp. SYSU T00b26]MDN4472668.1 leucyl aminopeptidase [Demequina sp. SYSU T00b26]
MTSLNATSDIVTSIAADALILGVDAEGTILAHPQVPAEALVPLQEAASLLDVKGKCCAVTVLPGTGTGARRVVLVGIGEGSARELREAAGTAARSCGKDPDSVVVAIPAADDAGYTAIAEGAVLGAYSFRDYKTDAEPAEGEEPWAGTAWSVAGASEAAIERASILIAAIAGVRDLVNTPPRDMFPGAVAAIAQELGAQTGAEVTIWEPEQLAKEGYGGILGVGMGSARLPRLVRVEWAPEDAKAHVALVGKGITFDTGGISLKPPKGMETMKSDMSGSAVVLHATLAAARAKLPVKVTAWLCLAENMPSGTAQRPSDVIKIYGGKTVEVMNTDAEGRLVMADGLARAIEDNPDVVLDVATLTGAQGVALGSRTSAVMGDDAIRTEVADAAERAGEDFWPMPLPGHLREGLESTVADLKNIGDPMGGMLSAGLFLKEFVGDTPWGHLDIARPAFNEGAPWGWTVKGATGHSVRTLVELFEQRAQA